MAARTVIGPEDRYERRGAQSFRDIRPFTARLSEGLRSSASGFVLAMAAVGTWSEPAVIDLTVPASLLYAIWVLTRRPLLPMRLPKSAGRPDPGHLQPGSRKPKQAAGTMFIGWSLEGHELWVTPEDARQHMTIPGTTGAGKTTAIVSLLSNTLMQGSGFVLVDGKGDRDLFGKVLALARRFGREDDVRVLNFMVASGTKDSHTFNPFSIGNADAIRELLASQLGDQSQQDSNGVFRERAVALVGTLAPVLVWLRDHKGVELNIEVIRFAIELRWIWRVAMQKIVMLRDPETGAITEMDVGGEIPEDITWPLRAYLGELPGFDANVPLDKQKGDEPAKQHGFAQFYFTATFTQLAVSLGHIFRVDTGDIDMRDVVLNRRILLVNLPALENSDATLAALGKLVVASLRAMMAQLLGGSLEGDYTEADKPGMGTAPFSICFDEVAYYATTGLDRMLAMGRGLNVSFMLGFQEVSGIYARLGEKTASLLGNANLTIAMRQQDSGRTREWIEKTAGQTQVTQATSYQGAVDGAYREARHAELRTISRVDWNDLTALIEGEAIFLFGGTRVYGRVVHAKVDDSGVKRLGRTVQLAAPNVEELRSRSRRHRELAARIERGDLANAEAPERCPVLAALRDGFIAAARAGRSRPECARDAIEALAAALPAAVPSRPPPPADGSPVTTVWTMLASAAKRLVPGPPSATEPGPAGNADLVRALALIEARAGQSPPAARSAALRAVAERDAALTEVPQLEPPSMTSDAFCDLLRTVLDRLQADQVAGRKRAA